MLEIKYDETELSEYCKNNLVSSSATSGNGSGLSIKEKLTEFLSTDCSADFYSPLKYKKDETLYKKVASMLVSLSRLCVSKTEEQQLNLTKLVIEYGILTKSLTSIVIPEGVPQIGLYAFWGCRSLYGGLRQKLRSLGYTGPF